MTADFKSHLVLNGTTKYVNIPAGPYAVINGDVTIEAVIRTDDTITNFKGCDEVKSGLSAQQL